MATKTKKKAPKAEPTLVFEDGHYWIKTGRKKVDAGVSRIYAERLMAEQSA